MIFNTEKFESTLIEEAEPAFRKIIESFGEKGIYSLALYNSGDSWTYLLPTFSTMHGLRSVALKYKKDNFYKNTNLEDLEYDLKWSPCDSPHHELYVSALPNTTMLLEGIREEMDQVWDDDSDEKYFEIHNSVVNACLRCLKQLEESEVFSSLDRNSFVLNLLNGDQAEEERLERAMLLNPKNVFDWYQNEI